MFIVLYQWRARPGEEERFQEGWRRATLAIAKEYGTYGSRLCRAADGQFVGIAEWPSESAWRAAMARGLEHSDLAARQALADTADGGLPIMTLTLVADMLLPPPAGTQS